MWTEVGIGISIVVYEYGVDAVLTRVPRVFVIVIVCVPIGTTEAGKEQSEVVDSVVLTIQVGTSTTVLTVPSTVRVGTNVCAVANGVSGSLQISLLFGPIITTCALAAVAKRRDPIAKIAFFILTLPIQFLIQCCCDRDRDRLVADAIFNNSSLLHKLLSHQERLHH